jgi:hypothetical protein
MKTQNESIVSFRFIESEGDIIMAALQSRVNIDLKMAEQIVAERLKFSENKEHYLVVDVSKVLSITAEAKKYFQTHDGGLKKILGAALIATNPLAALIANIFIKTPTQFKSRFFSNESEALVWIVGQRKNRKQRN